MGSIVEVIKKQERRADFLDPEDTPEMEMYAEYLTDGKNDSSVLLQEDGLYQTE